MDAGVADAAPDDARGPAGVGVVASEDGPAEAVPEVWPGSAEPTGPDALDPWWSYAFALPLEPRAVIVELRKQVHR